MYEQGLRTVSIIPRHGAGRITQERLTPPEVLKMPPLCASVTKESGLLGDYMQANAIHEDSLCGDRLGAGANAT